nr:YjcQ family protein [Ligilactobacillus salivarius]
MIISSYAKVATKILKYLNDCYENGLEPNIGSLNANMLGRQYYQTLNMLSDDGYIKGIKFLDIIANHPITYPKVLKIISE